MSSRRERAPTSTGRNDAKPSYSRREHLNRLRRGTRRQVFYWLSAWIACWLSSISLAKARILARLRALASLGSRRK